MSMSLITAYNAYANETQQQSRLLIFSTITSWPLDFSDWLDTPAQLAELRAMIHCRLRQKIEGVDRVQTLP